MEPNFRVSGLESRVIPSHHHDHEVQSSILSCVKAWPCAAIIYAPEHDLEDMPSEGPWNCCP